MEWTRPPDLVCHPGEEQFALMLKTTKPARKLASGFEHMEAKRMRVEDTLAVARQTLDRADRNTVTLMSHVEQLVDEADTKVLDALSYLREASASGAASSASGAASSQEPAPPQFRPGEAVCHWWASWFKDCAEGKAPKQYGGKKGRPAWFSAEVLSVAGYQTRCYAGAQHTTHFYQVH